MNIIELAISTIAPHNCLGCGQTGPIFCDNCRRTALSAPPSRCYRCHQATSQNKTCQNCRKRTGLSHVWVAANYEGNAKKLVYKLKFDRLRAASRPMAAAMDENLPILPSSVIITHLPTANNRVRRRGYDQAQLIAKNLAKRRRLAYQCLLVRKGATRQVGSSRSSRFGQLKGVFSIKNQKALSGAHILLIDDVLTTGASVESAAKTLKAGGAKTIDVSVFAQP